MSADKKSSKSKKFNVGDAVQLRKSSEEYSRDNDPMGCCPIKTKGIITEDDGTGSWPLRVEWVNGEWNQLGHEALKLWKEESKDTEGTTDKSEEVETPCVKTPVPGTKYEVVLDLWSWNFKKGDILVFKRIDRDGTWEFEGVNTTCDRLQWLRPDYAPSVVQLVVDAEDTTTNSELPVIGEKYEIINTDIFASWVKVGDIFTLVGEIGNDYHDLDKEDKPVGTVSQSVPKDTFFEHVKKVEVEVKATEISPSTEETYVPIKGDKFKVINKGTFAAFNVGDIVEFVEEFVSYEYVTWLFTNGKETQECGKSYVWEQVERVVDEGISLVVGEEYEVINEDNWNFKIGDKVVYLGKDGFGWEFSGIVEGVHVAQHIAASHKTPYRVKKIVKSDTNHEKLLADLKTQIETQCLDLMKGTPFKTLEVTSIDITDGILSAIEAAVREDATDVNINKVSITPTYNLNVGNLDLSALTREQLCLIFDAIEEVL